MLSSTVAIRIASLCLLALAVGWVTTTHAQPEPMRWGSIPDEHQAMSSYPDDPDAAAVVLGSFGNFRVGDDLSMTYEIHRRIKILSEAGYDLATVSIGVRRGWEQVDRIEGQTFVPDGSGGFRRVQLNSGDVYEERDGDRTVARFTMPALEPGAIVEYRFRISSRSRRVLLPEWYFQGPEPTLWSEFRMRIPSFIRMNRHAIGPEPDFFIEEVNEQEFRPPARARSGGYRGGADREGSSPSTYRWVMKDVPAMRADEHVASAWNHTYGIDFALEGFYRYDRVRIEYHPRSETWANVVEMLLDHGEFGRRLRAPGAVRNQVADLIADVSTDADRAQRIYDFVRQNMVWTGDHRLYANRSIDRVLESRSGTSSEINLLLIAMLREAGVAADPVAVSTRSHGKIRPWFPFAFQFNHVVAQVEIGRQRQLADATDRHRPLGMLPLAALNGEGLLLASGRLAWVPLEPSPSTSNVEIEGAIAPDGRISGVMTGQFRGYPALAVRQRLAELEARDQRVEVDPQGRAFVEVDDIRFTDVAFEGLEGDDEITFELHFETDDRAQVMEHLMTINPILIWGIDSSPFSQPERAYPVDFVFPVSSTYIARLSLPEGYTVEELPDQARLFTPGNGLTYARIVSHRGGELHVRRMVGQRQLVFEPDEYPALRQVYDGITAADGGVVVITRVSRTDGEDRAAGDE